MKLKKGEDILRSVTISFPVDPKQTPRVVFEGEWTGKEVQVCITQLLKGYRQYVREKRLKEDQDE